MMDLFKRSSKGGRKVFTRVFFATDIHGSEDCFRKFVNSAKHYQADVLVLGGDVTGKAVVPIVEEGAGRYSSRFLGSVRHLRNQIEVDELVQLINRNGLYPYFTNPREMEELQACPEKVNDIFMTLMRERLESWLALAAERLGDSGVQLFMSGGNDDPFEIEGVLSGSAYVLNPEGKVVWLDTDHEMITLGYANETPWKCPRDIPDTSLQEMIVALANQLETPADAVFCLHSPPRDSQLDTCPRLDDSVYPPRVVLDRTGQPEMFGAGSQAVRNAIEEYQPLLGLHGHIHESRGVVRIGRTVCVNPGSEYSEGILRGVLINISKDGILSYQFTSG